VKDGPAPRAILFDWDNTLVDNWASIHNALNATFDAFDKPRWTLPETRARLRRSLRESFPELFGDATDDAAKVFYRHFHERHLETLRHLPGAHELLPELAGGGIYLGVVSNKTGTVLRCEAEHLGWTAHFGRIVGATDAKRDKPSCEPVYMALEQSGIAAGPDVWFVGDAGVDMECAHATGCVPVLISSADSNDEEFQRFPPRISLSDLSHLRTILRARLPQPL
jgi:phosphoglycolate phosphatase